MEFAPGSYLDTHPKFQNFVKAMQDDRICSTSNKELFEQNIKENLKVLKKHGGVNELQGLAENKAAIFVGASPALLYNVRELEGCDDNFIVVATNSSLKTLLKHNIKPHIVVVADASPILLERDLTVDTDLSDVLLMATTIVHPDVIKSWKGPISFIGMGCENEKLTKRVCKELNLEEPIPGAGNALNIAVNVALRIMGARTSIFIGMELSHNNGEYYCDGKESQDKSDEWDAYDIFGNVVKTTLPLILYKTYLEDLASQEYKNGFMFINATQAGIFGVTKDDGFLPYIYQMDLKEAIRKFKEAVELTKDIPKLEQIKYDIAYEGNGYVTHSHSMACAPLVAPLGKRVLDVGCGDGRGVRKLLELGCDAKGCDISVEVSKYWKGIKRRCKKGTCAWKLPYKDNSFDVLMACDVMEHIPPSYIFPTLREFSRVADKLFLNISFTPSVAKIGRGIEPHLSIYPPSYWKKEILEKDGWKVDHDGGQIFICTKRRD